MSNAVARANVTVTLRDADGTEEERRFANVFCDTYGVVIAHHLAGTAGATTLALTHVSLGRAGVAIHACDSIAGWSGTPVLDTASFREGTGSISRTVTDTNLVQMTSGAIAVDLSGAGDQDYIEFWLSVNTRSYLDLTAECIRLTTSGGNYYAATWNDVEEALGASLVDGTWTRVSIQKSAFTATGAPSWASIASCTLSLKANGVASLTAHWDGIGMVPLDYTVTAQTTAVGSEAVKVPVGPMVDNGDGSVTITTYLGSLQAVGTFRHIGLYGNGGATLAGIVAADPPISKTSLQSLTIEWVPSVRGA